MPTTQPPEVRLAVLEEQVKNMESDVRDIKVGVDGLTKRLGERPSWAVTIILTLLTGMVVGLAVALAGSVPA